MDLGLASKSVLVTESTAGIGKATARAFLREGAKVFVNGRFSETVEETVKELSQQGEVVGIVADVGTAAGTAANASAINGAAQRVEGGIIQSSF